MRAESIKAALAATAVRPGTKVAVHQALKCTYNDFPFDEQGAVFKLAGEHADARLVELRYVTLVHGDTVSCESCGKEFADAATLGMHVRRRHEGRPPERVIRDAEPGELAEAMAARDRAAAEAGREPSSRLRAGRTFVRNDE
jgi:hypothetical protein